MSLRRRPFFSVLIPVRVAYIGEDRLKIGLALGGGGVKGMAHIGILRVLESEKVPVDVIAGTSSGAIVGALYAAGKKADEIESLATSLGLRKWFARDNSGMGLFSTAGIHRILDQAIGDDVRIEDLPRSFSCVAVDLESKEEVVFDSGPLADAVCASSAYPGLYAPVRIGERLLFDGSVLNPVPFDIVRGHGADRVIAVDLGEPEPFFATLSSSDLRQGGALWQLFYSMSHQTAFRVIERSLGIMAAQLLKQKLANSPPDVIIYPQVQDVGLLDFHLIEICIKRGQMAGCERLGEIVQLSRSQPERRAAGLWRKWYEKLRIR
jgi:NTE family protein